MEVMELNNYSKIFLTFLIIFCSYEVLGNKCVPRSFGEDSIVCVCNSTYCDSTPEVDPPKKGTYHMYKSNKLGSRMEFSIGNIESQRGSGTVLKIDRKNRYQEIVGFGGAFTDSAGINILNMSKGSQDNLIETYFGKNGSRYNFGRLPIGGCDFSTRGYTLDDVFGDIHLEYFSLAEEDLKYKIPIIKRAKELSPDLKIVSAAWSAPIWMKTTNAFNGYGILDPKYFQSYSIYLLKFFKAYKKHDIDIWAISTGNEPTNSVTRFGDISNMGWITSELGRWLSIHFGPLLKSSEFNKTHILILDDQRYNLPWFVDQTFQIRQSKQYVSGIAVHFYFDTFIRPTILDKMLAKYPDKFILMTEACIGLDHKVCIGCWERTEEYILGIFQNLDHWSIGWIDWNLALNKQGGPNWNNNFVEAAIIVNSETDEFLKMPLYYAIHHFSRFVSSGSVKIKLTRENVPLFDAIMAIAFETPEKETIVIVFNKNNEEYKVAIEDGEEGFINFKISGNSLNTIIYKK